MSTAFEHDLQCTGRCYNGGSHVRSLGSNGRMPEKQNSPLEGCSNEQWTCLKRAVIFKRKSSPISMLPGVLA